MTDSRSDGLKWTAHTVVKKFEGDVSPFKGKEDEWYATHEPFEVVDKEGNLMLNEGINRLWDLVAGSSAAHFGNADGRIGVGNGTAVASAAQTDLQGGSTAYKAMDGGYPTTGTSQKITFRSSFGSGDANFAWEEWTIDNGASDAKNLNRKVESMGTKAAGTTWQITVDITLS